jgi:nascent polypeptide-associated complex subunit alpha
MCFPADEKKKHMCAGADAKKHTETEVDAGNFGEKEIELVMSQANVTRDQAINAMRAHNGDVVYAILELM